MKKMQHCFNCGAELGVYEHWHGDIEVCGASDCVREERNQLRAEHDERMMNAQEDNYERYR